MFFYNISSFDTNFTHLKIYYFLGGHNHIDMIPSIHCTLITDQFVIQIQIQTSLYCFHFFQTRSFFFFFYDVKPKNPFFSLAT